ncbi:hypothetical protein, partial [Enterobacter intestinihominis]
MEKDIYFWVLVCCFFFIKDTPCARRGGDFLKRPTKWAPRPAGFWVGGGATDYLKSILRRIIMSFMLALPKISLHGAGAI